MGLATQNAEFILQKLNVYFLLFNLLFSHNFDGKFLVGCPMSAKSNKTKCTLAKNFTKAVSLVNILHKFELLIVSDVESPLLGVWKR